VHEPVEREFIIGFEELLVQTLVHQSQHHFAAEGEEIYAHEDLVAEIILCNDHLH